MISEDLARKSDLWQYSQSPKYINNAVGYNNNSGKFSGMIEDLIISVGGVDVKTNVYTTEVMDPTFRFILGMPFLKAAKCSIENVDDDTCVVGLLDAEKGKRVKLVADSASVHETNKGMEQMLHLAHTSRIGTRSQPPLNNRASTRR